MAPEDNKNTENNNEALEPIVESFATAGEKVVDSSGFVPNNDSDINNLVNQKSVDPNKLAKILIQHPEEMDRAVKHAQNNPEIIEALLKKLIQDRTMMKKTVTFGQMLAIAGITVPVSVALGGIIGANLGAIGVGLGVMGAGLAVAGPTIGFVLAGIVGFVAIAALAFATYKYKDQIKSGAEDIGKKV